MTSLVEDTRWYGPSWRGYGPQHVPTTTELLAVGAVHTGESLPDYGDELEALPPEWDKRTWYVESPHKTIILLLIPDYRGFYLEDEAGDRWRPECLAEMQALLLEMERSPSQVALQTIGLQANAE